MISAGVLTISDKGYRGQRIDSSGPLIAQMLIAAGYIVEVKAVVPDNEEKIVEHLIDWVDNKNIRFVVTTGGTGLSPSDVTPEAMLTVIKYQIPGMAEAMRSESRKKTPNAMISRAIAGVRANSLIVNLPGSPQGAQENLSVILPAVNHALAKIGGDQSDCS
jgi:molybdopterin adenylyltransferase